MFVLMNLMHVEDRINQHAYLPPRPDMTRFFIKSNLPASRDGRE